MFKQVRSVVRGLRATYQATRLLYQTTRLMSSAPMGRPGSLAPTYPDNAPLPDNVRGPAIRDADAPLNYYGQPPLKGGEWKWYIPTYFWLGGTAAGSFLLAGVADLFGDKNDKSAVRWGRYISLTMVSVSPIMLILDLGRPERFHHMLRIFKPRSPMSVGTWVLLGSSAFIGGAAASQFAEDMKIKPDLARNVGRVANVAGMPLVALLGMYTGVLLSSSSAPLWARSRSWIAPMFFASGVARSAALIDLLTNLFEHGGGKELETKLARIEWLAMIAEFATSEGMTHEAGPIIAHALETGKYGAQHRWGAQGLGIGLPAVMLAASLFGKRLPRPLRLLASLASLAGGFMLYWSVTYAGQASADDPEAYFTWTSGDPELPGAEILEPRVYSGESGAEAFEASQETPGKS